MRDSLPPGAALQALGEHRLRDLSAPEPLFQLTHPDLAADFPRLRSLQAFAHNLPVQLTSFVGRDEDLAETRSLLGRVRLLTLTGAGGTGKTRLALQVAGDLLDEFADGVWFVPLASVADPSLIAESALSALGLREEPGKAPAETLTESLAPKRTLLVLDNCEHLIDACAHVAEDLLRACPDLRLLATSREPLQCEGEVLWRVPSLSVPEGGSSRGWPLQELVQYEAVRLFVDRATAADPRFAVTAENAAETAEICWRLDGIPLAIELAAARVGTHTVREIAARLDDRFALLTGGRRTALPRHQTLRAAVDWSYELLSEPEQALLRRLAAFAGGWTPEAAEAVCWGEPVAGPDMPNLLTGLVDKSLVTAAEQEGAVRCGLLQTVHEYARDRLEESGETMVVRERHRSFFSALAERGEAGTRSQDQAAWLNRLDGEHDNLRAALDWCREQHLADPELKMVAMLWTFWDTRGYRREGRRRLESALGRCASRTEDRAQALNGAAFLARGEGDYGRATDLAAEALELFRELGQHRGVAASLNTLGTIAWHQGDYGPAARFLEESVSAFRELGDRARLAAVLTNLGVLAQEQGDLGRATTLYEESIATSRDLGDQSRVAMALNNLANIKLTEGDHLAAHTLHREALTIRMAVGDRPGIAMSEVNLGEVLLAQGDYAGARPHYAEGLAGGVEIGDRLLAAYALLGLAAVAQGDGRHERSARLWAAADGLFGALGAVLPPEKRDACERARSDLAAALGGSACEAAWEAGRAMTLDEAVQYALAGASDA
jgi:non-specific serine/threonine protein kinase